MARTYLDKAKHLYVIFRKRLQAVYRELRAEYPSYPSHYIYTAIMKSLSLFRSHRRNSRKGENVKPTVEMLTNIRKNTIRQNMHRLQIKGIEI